MSTRQTRTYKLEDGTFVVSSSGVWVPGIYATQEAAEFAADLDEAVLRCAWDAVCPIPMTLDDLKAIRST